MRLPLHYQFRPSPDLLWEVLLALSLISIGGIAFGQQAGTAETAPAATSILDPTNHVGVWIWDAKAYDRQTCRLWRSFVIPKSTVTKALLRITCDNGYRLFLDGREIGRGSDWRTLSVFDVTWLLNPGLHVLAVEGFNDRLEAGVVFGMTIELLDQRVIEIASDDNWRIVPNTVPNWENKKTPSEDWPRATVAGVLGTPPWVHWPVGTISLPALRPVTIYFWQSGWFQITLLSICALAILICLHLMTRLAMQSQAQRLLHLERARIARDIHDDLGSRLTQLVLLGEVAQSDLPAASDNRRQIDAVCEKARDLSHVVDEIVWAVNSRRDTLRDFASYVCKYAQMFLKSRVRCRLDVEPDMPAIAFELSLRRNLLLAVKEALNNVAKHSGASEVFLRIHRRGAGLSVVVEDNGAGFDFSGADKERNGLANMFQRMREIDGHCLVTTQPGGGCRVEFDVPLTNARRFPVWLAGLLPRKSNLARPAEAAQVPDPLIVHPQSAARPEKS
jgi:two-component sensor histidine kinase